MTKTIDELSGVDLDRAVATALPNKSHFKPLRVKRSTHEKRALPEITSGVGTTTLLELPDAEFEAAVTQLLDSRFFSLADVAVIRTLREDEKE